MDSPRIRMSHTSELSERVASGDASPAEGMVVSLLRAGDEKRARELLSDAGVLPAGLDLHAEALANACRKGQLTGGQAVILFRILAEVDRAAAIVLGLAIWESGEGDARRRVVYGLPNMLAGAGLTEKAVEVFRQGVGQGHLIGDFRPNSPRGELWSYSRPLAQMLYERDRDAFNAASGESAVVWRPLIDDVSGVTKLRAVTPGVVTAADFTIAPREGGLTAPRRKVAATATRDGKYAYWQASVDDLLPGAYEIALEWGVDGAAGPVVLSVPVLESDGAVTRPGDHIGCDAAVFAARVAAVSTGARYRFEYGYDAARLDRSTEWRGVPPPRRGRRLERLYRQWGGWQPTSASAAWTPAPGGRSAEPVLVVQTPFARDRNQLNGIGAHDMALAIHWSEWRAAAGRFRSRAAPVGGGVQDLRDAELSFTVAGRELKQHGAAMHFWVCHRARRPCSRIFRSTRIPIGRRGPWKWWPRIPAELAVCCGAETCRRAVPTSVSSQRC